MLLRARPRTNIFRTTSASASVADVGPLGDQVAGDLLIMTSYGSNFVPVPTGGLTVLGSDQNGSGAGIVSAWKLAIDDTTICSTTTAAGKRLEGYRRWNEIIGFSITKGTGTDIPIPAIDSGSRTGCYFAQFATQASGVSVTSDPEGLVGSSGSTSAPSRKLWRGDNIGFYPGGTAVLSISSPWVLASYMVR